MSRAPGQNRLPNTPKTQSLELCSVGMQEPPVASYTALPSAPRGLSNAPTLVKRGSCMPRRRGSKLPLNCLTPPAPVGDAHHRGVVVQRRLVLGAPAPEMYADVYRHHSREPQLAVAHVPWKDPKTSVDSKSTHRKTLTLWLVANAFDGETAAEFLKTSWLTQVEVLDNP
jgi:hypothetical protein